VEIMKHGALDYIIKPIRIKELQALLGRLLEHRQILRDSQALRDATDGEDDGGFAQQVISQSESMSEVLSLAARSADSDAAVLIRGETGTGKEVVARAIHRASDRCAGPFVSVNIAALPRDLVESELFGHQKGAFTGAVSDRVGRFEQADGGTLFVDEVGDIPPEVQIKLLRTLQFGTFERVGDSASREADVRIISATNQPLERKIESGSFRTDFLYRLNVVEIHLPPLRSRKADIPLLVEHFIPRYASKSRKEIYGITTEAMDKLTKYSFPGNVRELENIVERAIVLCRGHYITEADIRLPGEAADADSILDPSDLSKDYDTKLETFERTMIHEALRNAGANQSSAARLLGITERRLRSRMERLGMRR
jgi:DNA-binding NtrC family response regulator